HGGGAQLTESLKNPGLFTTLGDGRVAITGGIRDSGTLTSSGISDPKDHTYEIYDPLNNVYQQNPVARYLSTQLWYGPGLNGDSGSKLGEYPRCHVIAEGNGPTSDGYLFVSHQFKGHGTNTGDRSAKVDIKVHPETWTSPAVWSTSSAYSGTGFRRSKGTSTLWPNLGVSLVAENTVVRLGGTLQSISDAANEVVTKSVEACLASGGGGAWTALPSLNNARQWPDLVLLADGSLFVVGGAANIQVGVAPNDNDPIPVMNAEILVPGNSTWNAQPNMFSSRLYHSTALLLPSAKVMTGGGEYGWLWIWKPGGRAADFQVFVPPYLEVAQPRLVITQVPTGLIAFSKTGQQFTTFRVYYTTPDGSLPDRVVLTAPGSVTHHFDTQQRYVELVIQGMGEDATGLYVDVYPPLRTGDNGTPIGSHAVPGYYMLFLLANPQSTTTPRSCLGVPSEAAWIQLG
ncbi:MAG TPA: galactose oxidase early set domain-containing protein, partial [Planctomycetota bacterium]|nr:galactose oxidase early set domain-containing protein [Planctomycetota bacterium]